MQHSYLCTGSALMSPLNIFPVCRCLRQFDRIRCSCWPLPLHLRVQCNVYLTAAMQGILTHCNKAVSFKGCLVSHFILAFVSPYYYYNFFQNCQCIHVDMTLMLLHVKVELISVTPLTFNNISECICWLKFMIII